MKSTSTSNRPILGVFLLAQSSYVVEAALLHCSAKDSGSHICWGLPKPCNFTVGKNNRSLFHVLRDLYSPSAKSSVYHQCLGINTQHRLFAKIFWKAREFSCSISELWMSSVHVHWECLFPFLFCFFNVVSLKKKIIGVFRLISQCLLLFQNDQNIWKTLVAPGLGPQHLCRKRTKKAWCNSWFNLEWLETQLAGWFFEIPWFHGFRWRVGGWKFSFVYSVSKNIPGGQQDLFFFSNNSIIDIIDIIDISDIRYLFHAFELFPTCEKKTPPWFSKFLKHQLGHTLAKTLRWQSLQKRTLVYSWFAHCWNILLSMPRSVVLHMRFACVFFSSSK